MKQAVGTSLVIIAMNTFSGFLGYAGKVTIPWPFVLAFTAIAVVGILAGTRLVRAATPAQLKRAFAVFLLVVGALVFYQNRTVFHHAVAAGAVDGPR
jgi:uncharacterized membrane protein YfcA